MGNNIRDALLNTPRMVTSSPRVVVKGRKTDVWWESWRRLGYASSPNGYPN